MPKTSVTVNEQRTVVTVTEASVDVAITENPVEIVTGTSGPQGATGVVTAVAPITYDLSGASVGLNVGANLETSANFLKVTDDLTAIDSIAFDTTAGETSAVAKLAWNDTDGTLEFGLKGGNVTLQIGQEQVVRVRNNTGSTLANGSVVYITSANAGQINVSLASNTDEPSSSKTLGVLTEEIANGQQGFCTTQGLVRGLNTSALTEGAIIWLGANGGLTTTRPTQPAHSVAIGVCVSQSSGQSTNGIIFVRVINGFELEELHDVLITSPADNEVLTYEASSGLWKNKTNPADGVTSITASSPLTGGTITSTGTIGLDQTALSIQPSQVAGTAVITTDSRLSDTRTTTNALTLGDGLSGTSFDGSTAVTAAVDSTIPRLTASQTFTGAQNLVSSAAAVVPLTVTGASGQTASLFEAKTSAGTIKARFTAGGSLLFPQTGTSINADSGATTVNANSASTVHLTVKGAASQTADLMQVQTSAGTTVTAIKSTGEITAPQATLTATSASTVPLTVTGASGQTANLLSAQISGGTTRFQVGPTGRVAIGSPAAEYGSSFLSVNAVFATSVGAVIRGAASQTANLQEWQNSAGSILARVSSGGEFATTNNLVANAVVGATGSATLGASVLIRMQANSTLGGGWILASKMNSAPGPYSASNAALYFRDGTTAGTLKLVVRAGAGAETTVLDNIPTT